LESSLDIVSDCCDVDVEDKILGYPEIQDIKNTQHYLSYYKIITGCIATVEPIPSVAQCVSISFMYH